MATTSNFLCSALKFSGRGGRSNRRVRVGHRLHAEPHMLQTLSVAAPLPRRTFKGAIAATITCAILTVPLAGGASAEAHRRLSKSEKITKLQRECYLATVAGSNGFTTLESGITENQWLAPSHKTALTAMAVADHALLTTDRATIGATTSADALKAACLRARTHLRNLRFDVAKARGAANADHFDADAAAFQALLDQANAALDQLEANSVDVTTQRVAVAYLQQHLHDTETSSGGLGDAIIAIILGEGAGAAFERDRHLLEAAEAFLAQLTTALNSLAIESESPPAAS